MKRFPPGSRLRLERVRRLGLAEARGGPNPITCGPSLALMHVFAMFPTTCILHMRSYGLPLPYP